MTDKAQDRVMVDIETLGTNPGAAIISIGACRFRPDDGVVGKSLYVEIDVNSCLDAGLHIDDDTLDWWQDQDPDLAPLNGDTGLVQALARLEQHIGDADEVWANSPAFDCELLKAAYDAVSAETPWEYYHTRDVRTLKNLPVDVSVEQTGDEHHALDDARNQARMVAETLAELYRGGQR